jgi:glutamate-ammonia-ligase adenylyltransferase
VTEIRRIKARVDSERLPRNADPLTHVKLGRGGLADIEWTVQLLQLQHAHAIAALRTTSTRLALAEAAGARLITPETRQVLDDAWVLCSRVRNALMLIRGRGSDQLPRQGKELAGVARLVAPGMDPGEFLDDYLRVTRRARSAVDATFLG